MRREVTFTGATFATAVKQKGYYYKPAEQKFALFSILDIYSLASKCGDALAKGIKSFPGGIFVRKTCHHHNIEMVENPSRS